MAKPQPSKTQTAADHPVWSFFGALFATGFLAWLFHDVFFLGSLFGFFLTIWIIVGLYAVISAPFVTAKRLLTSYSDIRAAPGNIVPLTHDTNNFDHALISESIEPVPAIQGEWLSILKDQTLLQSYAVRLDAIRSQHDAVAQQAVDAFNRDRNVLLAQQKSVLRRAFQAKLLIKRLKELPSISMSVESLPQFRRLAIPQIPNYLTPAQYARKYQIRPGNAIAALGRAFTTQGVNPANLWGAAIGAAIGVVMAKQIVSKALRALEDARGQVGSASIEARSTVELLKRSHSEMVDASQRLKSISEEIDKLAGSARRIPGDARSLSHLKPDEREKVTQLWYWVLCADQMAKSSIV